MVFNGFQKLTLLDYPGRVACTVFTCGCNLRCPFCHNASLVLPDEENDVYKTEEILGFLNGRKGLLDGVAITGGEPLLHNDLFDFMHSVKEMGYSVKLDTNGTMPQKLKKVLDEKLADYIAVDIKNSKEKYALTVGIENFDISPIEETVDMLINGDIDFEFRTTVVDELHDVEDFESIGNWIKGSKNYFIQNFVDSGNLLGENLHAAEKEKLEKCRLKVAKYVPNTAIRGI